MLKRISICLLCFAVVFWSVSCRRVKTIANIMSENNGEYTCEYDGIKRSFLECVPDTQPIGIIIMLHGAGSSGEAFRLQTGMDELACPQGYVVVYVSGIVDPQDSGASTGWNSGLKSDGPDDIGFLCSLASYMQDKYSLTKDDTFAVGFSNGAFMTYRIATEGQDYFGATVSVAGMMPKNTWQLKPDKSCMSVLQINGDKDEVVPMNYTGTADSSINPAIEDVIAYFAEGLDMSSSDNISTKSTLTKHTSSNLDRQVWQILIQDGRHSWSEEQYCGFNINEMILTFLDAVG